MGAVDRGGGWLSVSQMMSIALTTACLCSMCAVHCTSLSLVPPPPPTPRTHLTPLSQAMSVFRQAYEINLKARGDSGTGVKRAREGDAGEPPGKKVA